MELCCCSQRAGFGEGDTDFLVLTEGEEQQLPCVPNALPRPTLLGQDSVVCGYTVMNKADEAAASVFSWGSEVTLSFGLCPPVNL